LSCGYHYDFPTMPYTTVMSVGGSIVVPDSVDTGFVTEFVGRMRSRLEKNPSWRLAIVVGGGATARRYQSAARDMCPGCSTDTLDTIGVAATRVNAQVMRAAMADLCRDPVITNPTEPGPITGRVVVAGGWKPGFSTDNVAVRLAESLGADTVINLSNIKQIFTADPKVDPNSSPLTHVSWREFFAIAGDEWVPGKNTPFDPIASRRAASLSMRVVAADGRDLDNLDAILDGESFVGTTVGPE